MTRSDPATVPHTPAGAAWTGTCTRVTSPGIRGFQTSDHDLTSMLRRGPAHHVLESEALAPRRPRSPGKRSPSPTPALLSPLCSPNASPPQASGAALAAACIPLFAKCRAELRPPGPGASLESLFRSLTRTHVSKHRSQGSQATCSPTTSQAQGLADCRKAVEGTSHVLCCLNPNLAALFSRPGMPGGQRSWATVPGAAPWSPGTAGRPAGRHAPESTVAESGFPSSVSIQLTKGRPASSPTMHYGL